MRAGNQRSVPISGRLKSIPLARLANAAVEHSFPNQSCSKENGDVQSGRPCSIEIAIRAGRRNVSDRWFEVRGANQMSLIVSLKHQFAATIENVSV